MIKEAIEFITGKVEELKDAASKAAEIKLGELPYIHHGEKLTPLQLPDFPKLQVSTLAGLVEIVKLKLTEPTGPMAIVVSSPTCASLVSAVQGPWKQRQTLAVAQIDPAVAAFQWGAWKELDDFVIELQAKFGEGGDRNRLCKILGNVQGGILRTSTDDGISQTVSVRAGVTLVGEEKLENPVKLQPYRTFSDLEQPVSSFVLRLKQQANQAPSVALFEADGGLWKRAAVDAAYKFLTDAALGIPVLR